MGLQEAESRRLQNRAEARRVILDAVEALLLEEGYQGFSMRKLVDRCGYAAPTIYHYFGDKTGLFRELVDARFGVLVDELERVRLGDDLVENARALGRAFVDFGLRHSTHYWLLYITPDGAEGEQSAAAEEARRILEAPMLEISARGQLQGMDLETARQAIWALCHGVISLQTSRSDVDWSPDLFEQAFDVMLRGMVASRTAKVAKARKEKTK